MSNARQKRDIRQKTGHLVDNLSVEEIRSLLANLEIQILRYALKKALDNILLDKNLPVDNGEK